MNNTFIGRWFAAVCLCLVLWTATPAQSQMVAGDVLTAQNSVRPYFEGEKQGALGFMLVGGTSLLVGGGLR